MTTSKRTVSAAPKRSHAPKQATLSHTVTEAAKNAGAAVEGAADAVGLSQRVAEYPYGMVSAALAVGYVAGGGLFTPTTGRLIQLIAKLVTVPFVQTQLLEVAESAVDSVLEHTRKMGPK
jgi:hypothetical protein